MKQGKTEKAVFAKLATDKVELAKDMTRGIDNAKQIASSARYSFNADKKNIISYIDNDLRKLNDIIQEIKQAIDEMQKFENKFGIELPAISQYNKSLKDIENDIADLSRLSTELNRVKV